jgi:3-isopropylmalate dehydrogenase
MIEIPVIPGDGVGPEVINAGQRVLDAAADATGVNLSWREFPYGATHYLDTGETLPQSVLETLAKYDAIYFGSVGDPRVEPGVLEQGIILKLRFAFDQYINLRPIQLLEGVETPVRGITPDDVDFTFIRENTEDLYVGVGGRFEGSNRHTHHIKRELYDADVELTINSDADEFAYQLGIASREGCERVLRYGFERAVGDGHSRLTLIDKANVMSEMYGLWRDVAESVSEDYAGIELETMYADAAAMDFIRNPARYETVVAPNLFGDILTDLCATLQGGIGLCPGANLNPDGTSLFEPLHGSAPDIAGDGIANPTATIWAGSMLLDHLGEEAAADRVFSALEETLAAGDVRTPDLGGDASTGEFTDAVVERVN